MHTTVLRVEAVECLVTKVDGNYVDATFGRGGHSREILRRLGPAGRVLAIDRDPQAIAEAEREFADESRLAIEHAPFSRLGELVARHDWTARVDGLLLDLGVSSPQLDDARRGFSFQQDGPLDMRMNPQQGSSAAQWLATAAEDEIARVLWEYGDERFSRRMARAVVRERAHSPIKTTFHLADVLAQANPAWERNKHPATRAFQAIRIHVNREMEELDQVLEQSLQVLAPGGRLVVISFHSLEDRRVKRFMRDHSRAAAAPRRLPLQEETSGARLRRLGKPVRPGDDETRANPRARSAIMRVAEKIQ